MPYDPIKPRARIGVIISSGNGLVEPEFRRYFPPDVEPYATRVRMRREYRRQFSFQDLVREVVSAALALSDAHCDVIVVDCTGASMSGGVDGDQVFVRAIQEATGIRTTTAAIAIASALRALSVKRLVLVTKDDDAHLNEAAYLTQAGFEVVGGHGAGIDSPAHGYAMPSEFWYDATVACRSERADGYFISCTNVRAIGAVEPLEKALRRPVITSNQAVLWHALRVAGVGDPIDGIGALLKLDSPQPALLPA